MFQLLLFSLSNNFLMIYMLSLQFLIHLIGTFFYHLEDILIIFHCFLCLAIFLMFSYQVIHCYKFQNLANQFWLGLELFSSSSYNVLVLFIYFSEKILLSIEKSFHPSFLHFLHLTGLLSILERLLDEK